MQLAKWKEAFAEMGVEVVGMTYDSVEVLQKFHAKNSLPYPLLRDEEVRHVNGFKIRNEDYDPGHQGYGIPHPGIFFIDQSGTIRAKFAVPGYRRRPPLEAIHDTVANLVVSGG